MCSNRADFGKLLHILARQLVAAAFKETKHGEKDAIFLVHGCIQKPFWIHLERLPSVIDETKGGQKFAAGHQNVNHGLILSQTLQHIEGELLCCRVIFGGNGKQLKGNGRTVVQRRPNFAASR